MENTSLITQGQPLTKPKRSKCPMITVTLWTFLQTTVQVLVIYAMIEPSSDYGCNWVFKNSDRDDEILICKVSLALAAGLLLWNLLIVFFTFLYSKSSKPCWFQSALIMRIMLDLTVLLYGGERAYKDIESYDW